MEVTQEMSAWTYILASRRNGTLYIGATTNLVRRVWEHRQGAVPGFTSAYGVFQLVWFEEQQNIFRAMQREHTMKHWKPAWKIALIEESNPEWEDLYPTIASWS